MSQRRLNRQVTRREAIGSLATTATFLGAWKFATIDAVGQGGDVAPNVPPPDIDEALRDIQRTQLAALRAAWDSIGSATDLAAYQREVRSSFQDVLGPWPARDSLTVERVGLVQRGDYAIERLLLESRGGFFVPINLYLPARKIAERRPAVLCPLGHAPAGKAHRERDSYQHLFITLARLGFVVCAFDPLGQGEREPYGAATGNHHAIQGLQSLSTSHHLAHYFLWDAQRCLDYLELRAEVDPTRIACAGCSGGGAMTQYLAALDERIRVAIPASWITTTQVLTEDEGLHVESWFPRMASPHGAGTLQLLACIAPRPLLILGNHDDEEFPPGPMEQVFLATQRLYERVGARDQVAYVDCPTRHGFWPAARLEVYRFLLRHLAGDEMGAGGNAAEPAELARLDAAAEPEEEATLWCAPEGQVRNLTGAKTVFDLNREVVGSLRRERQRLREAGDERAWRGHVARGLRELVSPRTLRPRLAGKLVGDGKTRDIPFRRHQLVVDDFESTWVDVYAPEGPPDRVTLVIADDVGAGGLRAAGIRAAGGVAWHVHGLRARERREYLVGEHRAFRWARLLIATTRWSGTWLGAKQPEIVQLCGIGPFAVWAVQLAPLLEETRIFTPDDASATARLRATAIAGCEGFVSLEQFCDDRTASHSLLATPGQWRWFDEVDIAALLADRPLWLADARDRRGRPAGLEALERHLDWAVNWHSRRGSRIRLTANAPTAEELIRWLG